MTFCSPALKSLIPYSDPTLSTSLHFLFSLKKCSFPCSASTLIGVLNNVTLLSNHFKNTHTHAHTSLLFCAPVCCCVWERVRVSFDTPKLFFLNASHFLMLLSWLSLQVGWAAAIWDTGLYSPPLLFSLCCLCAGSSAQTTNCHTSLWHLVILKANLSLMHSLPASCHYSKGALSFAASYLDTSN